MMTADADAVTEQPTAPQPQAVPTDKHFRKVLGDLTRNNLGQVKTLVRATFGISGLDALSMLSPSSAPTTTTSDPTNMTKTNPLDFNDSVYNDALALDPISRLVYFNDVCVGVVLCQYVSSASGTLSQSGASQVSSKDVQVVALGVLPAYIGLGLETLLIQNIKDEAKELGKIGVIKIRLSSSISLSIVSAYASHDGGVQALFERYGFVKDTDQDDVYVWKLE